MLAINLSELERTNAGLHKGRMGGEDHTSSMLVRFCTSTNETYADVLDRVLSVITEIWNAQQMIDKC